MKPRPQVVLGCIPLAIAVVGFVAWDVLGWSVQASMVAVIAATCLSWAPTLLAWEAVRHQQLPRPGEKLTRMEGDEP